MLTTLLWSLCGGGACALYWTLEALQHWHGQKRASAGYPERCALSQAGQA